MPSLFKKKSDQPKGPLSPAWHPNFRNFERLPDTKVVRTQFFVNFVASAVAAGLLIYFCFQEYRLNNLQSQVAELEQQIDENKKDNGEALALDKKFAEEEGKVKELDRFLQQQRLVLSEFLLQLGASLPADVAIDAVEVRDTTVSMRGRVAGTPEEASGRASAYFEQLRRNEYFKGLFESVNLNNLTPEPSKGNLVFDLALPFKGGAKK